MSDLSLLGKVVMLEAHAIDFDWDDERLLVEEVACVDGKAQTQWIDVTNWSRRELLEWLGY